MIIYLLKSAGCLALLLFFYHFILEKEKMHNFNRFYLLGSILFSFLVPLSTITIEAVNNITNFEQYDFTKNTNPTDIKETFNYGQILVGIYVLISLIFLIRFGINLFKIIQKIRLNENIKYEKAILVLVDDKILPHTFWNTIFLNKNEYETGKIEEELFTHELTHVTQKHTLDVILIELLQILFWINPIFIFLKKAIQLNHEFLADQKVINQYKNTFQYQHLLLNKVAWKNEYYLASNLNYSLTKKRLTMMTKQSSQTKVWLKKLAVIPLLLGFILLFAKRVEAKNANSILDFKVNELNLEQSKDTIPSNIAIKNEKTSATKVEIREYKKLLAKGKKNDIFKQKDVLKMQYLYKVMSEKQKNSVENVYNLIPPPPIEGKQKENNFKIPPPPPPISTLDYVIKMAKKDATFYYENEEIISDKAIELIKRNKHLNIDAGSINLKNPVVRISKKAITFKRNNKEKKEEPIYYLDGKIISKKEMETLTPDKIKSVNVKKNKDGSGSVYITSCQQFEKNEK